MIGRNFLSRSTQLDLGDIRRSFDRPSGRTQSSKRKSLAGYFRESIKLITMNGCRESSKIYSSSSESKYAQLQYFMRSGDTLHASMVSLSSYRAWPNMHETRFALYKLPMQVSVAGQEYAGRPSADKSGKALFFLLLPYQKGKRLLIATKILEGTRYVLHPNGYAMFIVNIDDPSLEPFLMEIPSPLILNTPLWKVLQMNMVLDILFVFEDGLLAFMWKEYRDILTFARAFEERQRLDLNFSGAIMKGLNTCHGYVVVAYAIAKMSFRYEKMFSYDYVVVAYAVGY